MAGRLGAACAGIGAAAAAQIVSIAVAGGGHGWVEPFFFGPAMWLTLPLMAVRVSQHSAGSVRFPAIEPLVLLVGLGLDTALCVATNRSIIDTGRDEFLMAMSLEWPIVVPWLALWLSWQLAALFLLYARVRKWAGCR